MQAQVISREFTNQVALLRDCDHKAKDRGPFMGPEISIPVLSPSPLTPQDN